MQYENIKADLMFTVMDYINCKETFTLYRNEYKAMATWNVQEIKQRFCIFPLIVLVLRPQLMFWFTLATLMASCHLGRSRQLFSAKKL